MTLDPIKSLTRGSLALAGLALLPLPLLLVGEDPATAASSSAGDEFLSTAEAVPPNVMFVIDFSDKMNTECFERDDDDPGTSTCDDQDSIDLADPCTCIDWAAYAVERTVKHYDWANFGVVGTMAEDNSSDATFFEIASLGTSHADLVTALQEVDLSDHEDSQVSNIAEATAALWEDYFSITSTGEGFSEAPIEYACQETHVVVISTGVNEGDADPVVASSSGSLGTDVECDADGNKADDSDYSGSDEGCLYDNVVHYLYNGDARSDLDGDQNAIVHTVGVRVQGSDLSEGLFGNASTEIDSEGIYTVANQGKEIVGSVLEVLGYVEAGFYSRSAPVVSAEGDRLIYSFYEITGDNPLGEGHVRAYELDNDPTSVTYGQVIDDNGVEEFGYALWDAGDLLVSRPVSASEPNPDDRDGFGQRDIYTWVPELDDISTSAHLSEDGSGSSDEGRMHLDRNFPDAVVTANVLEEFVDTGDVDSWDFDGDESVTSDDLQTMLDFVRGLPSAEFHYLGEERGYWKLGDSPHAVPVVVTARNDMYSLDPTYRRFLDLLGELDMPDIVLTPANDGMLHAFALEDDESTSAATGTIASSTEDGDEAGEELWAWVPGYVLYREVGEDWSGRIADLLWYGRTFLFDGSPVVDDVWIDMDGDGVKDCESTDFPDNCEWRRVVVVSQGKGGPVTLALDITVTDEPTFLWEQTNETDYSAMGYTVSTPVVTNLWDGDASHDRWVAIWGSGRAVPLATDGDYYESAEAAIYTWHLSADMTENYADGQHDWPDYGSSGHPEADSIGSTLSGYDTDANYEYGFISGGLAVGDVDSDGDADTLYFPVTASYEPSDAGDPDGDGDSGISDKADPGYTWMYKAIVQTDDSNADATPENLWPAYEWCEFVDPDDYGKERHEVYYKATTSWFSDGSLGVYWGTGSPYSRYAGQTGYFWAFKDANPGACGSTVSTICGSDGYFELSEGEGLTGEPIVYAGTVYFPTYDPDEDYCEGGQGRIYGLSFDDCDGAIDTDADGDPDAESFDVEGYPSSITISKHGSLFYGTSNPDTTGLGAIGSYTGGADPFGGVDSLLLREVF